VATLKDKIAKLSKASRPLNAYSAFRCVTADIISQYAFARCMDLTEESDDQFYTPFLDSFDAAANVIWNVAFSPISRKIGMAIPKSIAAAISKDLKSIFRFADEAMDSLQAYKEAEKKPDHPVIFDGLKSVSDDQIAAEAVDILAAGSDTTASSLSVGIWHIAHNQAIKTKLMTALKTAIPNINAELPNVPQLEAIP
jgi:cytochrome P450